MQNLVLVNQLTELAQRKGVTPGQLALSWVLARGVDVFPIPGTRSIKNLEVRCTRKLVLWWAAYWLECAQEGLWLGHGGVGGGEGAVTLY